MRSNERAAAAVGINVRNVKLAAFGISSFIAGVGGALYGYNFSSVTVTRFSALTALSLIAFAYVGGITMVSGALFAGLISVEALFPYALEKWFGVSGNWALLFGGVALIVTLFQNPEGVAGAGTRTNSGRGSVGGWAQTPEPCRGSCVAGPRSRDDRVRGEAVTSVSRPTAQP